MIPQNPTIDSLDLPPTLDEVRKAISQTSSGKAPGMNEVPAQLLEAAGPVAMENFHSVQNLGVPESFSK